MMLYILETYAGKTTTQIFGVARLCLIDCHTFLSVRSWLTVSTLGDIYDDFPPHRPPRGTETARTLPNGRTYHAFLLKDSTRIPQARWHKYSLKVYGREPFSMSRWRAQA
jgi:hypothetical protein